MNEPTLPTPMKMQSVRGEPRFSRCAGVVHADYLPEEFEDFEGLAAHITFNIETDFGHGADLFTYDPMSRALWCVYHDKFRFRCYRVTDVSRETATRIVTTARLLNVGAAFDEPLFFAAARMVLAGLPASSGRMQ